MEFTTTTKTYEPRTDFSQYESDEQDKLAIERLNILLEINAQTARENSLYSSRREKLEAEMMSSPVDLKRTFSLFGLILGTFPPGAIFLKTFLSSGVHNDNFWLFGLFLIINTLTAIVGYFSGRMIARMVKQAETYPWWAMIFLSPFIGIIWGIIAGGVGGAIVFLIGGLFGALIGGLVGGASMPLFIILHRWLKRGEFIEMKHFLPIALGIALTICSFILGFPRTV